MIPKLSIRAQDSPIIRECLCGGGRVGVGVRKTSWGHSSSTVVQRSSGNEHTRVLGRTCTSMGTMTYLYS